MILVTSLHRRSDLGPSCASSHEAFNRWVRPGGAERRRLCSLVLRGAEAAARQLEGEGAEAGAARKGDERKGGAGRFCLLEAFHGEMVHFCDGF